MTFSGMSDTPAWIVALRVLVVAALVAFGGHALWWGVRSGVLEYRCDREGGLADGTVQRTYRVGLQRSPRMFFHAHPQDDRVEYVFRTADGAPVSGDAAVSRERWWSLDVGSHVTVRYVPARPTLNRIEGEPIAMAEAVTMAVVGLALLLPLAFAGSSAVVMRSAARRRRGAVRATGPRGRRRG